MDPGPPDNGGKADCWWGWWCGDDPEEAQQLEQDKAALMARIDAVRADIAAQGGFGTIDGVGGVSIAYAALRAPQAAGALVILPGRAMPLDGLLELVDDLRQLGGISFYLMDHRGQGSSERLLDDPQKCHVDDFDNYITDLERFIDQVVVPDGHQQVYILGTSLGGTIATVYAERHPERVAKLFLISPMFQINFGWYTETYAYSVTTSMDISGQGETFGPYQGAFDLKQTFESNTLTHDPVRFGALLTLVQRNPSLAVGGATYHWGKEAIEGCREARLNAYKLTMPVLLFQAVADMFVVNWAQDILCTTAKHCTLVRVVGAYHGMIVEEDTYRWPILDLVATLLPIPEAGDNQQSYASSR
jgi:lysophospholipase